MFVIVVASCSVVLCLWLWISTKHPEVPTASGGSRILGHLNLVIDDPITSWKTEQKMYKSSLDNGGIVKASVGPYKLYVLTDPAECHYIANRCLEKPALFSVLKEMYGDGLLTADPQTWKIHRKFLNPAFNQQVLNSFIDDYCNLAKKLITDLECEAGKGTFSIRRYLYRHSMTIAFQTSIGPCTLDDSFYSERYMKATHEIFLLFYQKFKMFWTHLPIIFNMSSLRKKEENLMSTLKDITNEIINKRKLGTEQKHLNVETEKPQSVLDHMLKLAEEHSALTDETIRAHIDTILAAALDSTSTALTYALILIGSYPEVQERIYEELQEVLGGHNGELTKHDLKKLVYLEATIKETLRLYSPTPRVARKSQSEIKLRNYTFPVGSIFMFSLYGINRHPVWGPDANEFKPERWLNPDSLPTNHNAFASFSLGRRDCIGKVFAMMTMKITLAYILNKYKVTGDITKVKEMCDIILKPIAGHHISIEMRT